MTRRIAFARWHSDVPSGGNRYDDTLTFCLKAASLDVREYSVAGSWPFPSDHDYESLRNLLTGDASHAEQHWLINNILGAAAPDLLRAAATSGRRMTLLMHYFAADEPDQPLATRQLLEANEAAAVAVSHSVIATSEWAASEVTKRYGRTDIIVAQPGVDSAPLAPGSLRSARPPHLLWLGRLTRTKDPATFIEALATLRHLDWTAQLVGPETIDPELSRDVRARITSVGLADRVEVTGARAGAALEAIWHRTDLLVHTARSEAYGMVMTEALARGIPSVVPAGTGAVEAQHGVGETFVAGDAEALAKQIGAWLTDATLRNRWREDAAAQRHTLPTWQETARIVAAALAN
jgi:glycosyltransferase involved in cell wall biosynthesis